MKSNALIGCALAAVFVTAGCDSILSGDNYDEPKTILSGEVTYQGQPVGIRTSAITLQLWQTDPGYQIVDFIPVNVNQEGFFSAKIFDGNYEAGMANNAGPWVNNSTRTPVVVKGNTTLDYAVQPYYTILEPRFTFATSQAQPCGTITGTFKVNQAQGSNTNLEFVGVYIGLTRFVDRSPNTISIANTVRERNRAAVLTQLNSNSDISIPINLPNTIYRTQSPDVRDFVFVRVGVKVQGITELWYSPVEEISIAPAAGCTF